MSWDYWRYEIAPKYIASCAKCGRDGLKKKMYSLYVKKDSYSPVRILCHICPDCMPKLLDELEVTMPE